MLSIGNAGVADVKILRRLSRFPCHGTAVDLVLSVGNCLSNGRHQMTSKGKIATIDGGKLRAAEQPIVGLDAVVEVHASLARMFAETMSRLVRYGFINGLPGFVTIEQGGVLQTTALEIEDDRIVAIYVVRNPDKLRHLGTVQ
jgi:RNA polymerase sigma-70 factor (ECF subfamily)